MYVHRVVVRMCVASLHDLLSPGIIQQAVLHVYLSSVVKLTELHLSTLVPPRIKPNSVFHVKYVCIIIMWVHKCNTLIHEIVPSTVCLSCRLHCAHMSSINIHSNSVWYSVEFGQRFVRGLYFFLDHYCTGAKPKWGQSPLFEVQFQKGGSGERTWYIPEFLPSMCS